MMTKCTNRRYNLKVEQGTCVRCKKIFEYPHTTGRLKKYCEECCTIVLREQKSQVLREYRQTPEGKAANVLSSTKYRQTLKGKTIRARIMREYAQTPEGQVAVAESHTKYRQTPEGKVAYARMCAKRRELSTDPDSYVARVELLHTMCEPCVRCQAQYKITHQIDHIIALCLGGTDKWSNLQPLCILCHREKTGEDIHELMEKHRRRT